jgi:RNA polymerase sigma-70 factor (ECF subfamily)
VNAINLVRPIRNDAARGGAGVVTRHLLTFARGLPTRPPAGGLRRRPSSRPPMSSHTYNMPSHAGEDSVPTGRHLEATEAARGERDRALAALLQQAASGNASAFEAFYDQTLGYAQALARRMLRGSADVEDVLASAYFQVWRELERFDAARGGAVTWLLTIVRSRALDALRERRSNPQREPGDEEAEVQSDAPGPDELLQSTEAGARLRTLVADLNAQERWVLGLAYFREMSHSEIATLTGLPLGTVKSLILRSQTKLREMLVRAEGPASTTKS